MSAQPVYFDMCGYGADEVIGCNPRIFQSGRHDAAFYQAMWSALLNTGKWSGEVWDRHKIGEIYPKALTITAVYDLKNRVTHYVAVFRDISQHKKSEQAIHKLAFYDSLTMLPNRSLLLNRIQQAMLFAFLIRTCKQHWICGLTWKRIFVVRSKGNNSACIIKSRWTTCAAR